MSDQPDEKDEEEEEDSDAVECPNCGNECWDIICQVCGFWFGGDQAR